MKLMTHNMLSSKCLKGVVNGFPLKINAKDVKVAEVPFSKEQIARLIPKLDWNALYEAAEGLGQVGDLPKEVNPDYENDDEFLKKAHRVLLEVEVINGELVCPETGRLFPIKDGIPNMLLNEDEV